MAKEIKDMTDEELVKELEAIEQQIEITSYGMFELRLRDDLYKEIDKRGVELQRAIKFKIVKNGKI